MKRQLLPDAVIIRNFRMRQPCNGEPGTWSGSIQVKTPLIGRSKAFISHKAVNSCITYTIHVL